MLVLAGNTAMRYAESCATVLVMNFQDGVALCMRIDSLDMKKIYTKRIVFRVRVLCQIYIQTRNQ